MAEETKNTNSTPSKGGYNRNRRGRRPYYNGNKDKNKSADAVAPEKSEAEDQAMPQADDTPAVTAEPLSESAKSGEGQKSHKKPRSKNNRRSGKSKDQSVKDTSTKDTAHEDAAEAPRKDHPVHEAPHAEDKNKYRFVPDYWYEDEKKEEPKKPEPDPDPSTLIEIVGVKFKENGKIYYFAPMGYECPENLEVIVETARGIEFGIIAIPNKPERPEALVAPLRPVVRIATPADKARHDENVRKEAEAFKICEEKISEHGLEMKLIDAEYTFDNSKLTFYFCADGRIDFRELVKSLASVFRTRIELRQIGIRDEAKMLGGLGICGRPFCCSTFLYDFNQVSIRMAKEQNLSLNSAKISGTCGRLMCCLRYECETYEEEMKRTPKVDSIVKTPDGTGFVIETFPLTGQVKVKLGDADDAQIGQYSRDDVTVIGKRRGSQQQQHDNDDSDIVPENDL